MTPGGRPSRTVPRRRTASLFHVKQGGRSRSPRLACTGRSRVLGRSPRLPLWFSWFDRLSAPRSAGPPSLGCFPPMRSPFPRSAFPRSRFPCHPCPSRIQAPGTSFFSVHRPVLAARRCDDRLGPCPSRCVQHARMRGSRGVEPASTRPSRVECRIPAGAFVWLAVDRISRPPRRVVPLPVIVEAASFHVKHEAVGCASRTSARWTGGAGAKPSPMKNGRDLDVREKEAARRQRPVFHVKRHRLWSQAVSRETDVVQEPRFSWTARRMSATKASTCSGVVSKAVTQRTTFSAASQTWKR